ncbi:unnamed protein product [Schistosoma rodhaini]|uniref:PDZ domain-containing protein n=1 Tax=Schistosoma mansoni TaxID=6183 RepID=A0A5K4FF09_SCHMA|nr:unnamed protein product [Schistosoma rodhaini]
MTTLTEATYAFISNNLQDTSKSSTVRKYELIQNEANKTTCHFIKQSLSKGPSLRKLNSTRGYFSRIRNSRNDCKNDGIQLKHIRSYTPDNNMNTFEKYSLSQDSSIPPTASQSSISSLSSSSSTRQLSPVTTPKAPLLGTNYKRNLNKNKIFRDHFESDNMLTQSTHNYCDKYGLKEQSKSREHTYHCGNTTNKLHSPPLSGLKMKAKRVWNVFERKISNNNNKGISQSKSVGNLQYTSTLSPTSENLITNHNESNVRSPHIMPSKHHIQNDHSSRIHLNSDKRSILCFPHSKSFEISRHLDSSKKLNRSPDNEHICTNMKLHTDNNHDEKYADLIYSMGIIPHQPISHCINSCSHSEDYPYRIYDNVAEKLTIKQKNNNKQCQETGHQNHLTLNLKDQSSNHKYAENCIFILPAGLPFQEIREISVTRSEAGQRFGMRIEKFGKGTYLTTVLPGSLASQAGLKVGDEILHLNGISLQSISINSINQLVRSTRQLKIAYRPRTMLAKIRFILVKKINGRVGIRLKRMAEGLYVDVVLPNSAAYEAGIKEGDELICVNNQIVTSWTQEAASKLLRELPDEDFVMLHFREFFHPHGFNNIAQLNKQLKTVSIKESLSMPHCSTLKLNSSPIELNYDQKHDIDESFSFINSLNKTSDNTVNKEYVPLNFQDTLNQNIHTDNSNSTIPTSNVRTLNHDEVLCDYPVNDTRFDVIPLQSHTRILNSFSDYTLDCPKCFINEPQIQ